MKLREKIIGVAGVVALSLGLTGGIASADPVEATFTPVCYMTSSFLADSTIELGNVPIGTTSVVISNGFSFTVNTFCNVAPWAVNISGSDFATDNSALATVPVSQLRLQNKGGSKTIYPGMDPALDFNLSSVSKTLSTTSSQIQGGSRTVGTEQYGFPGQVVRNYDAQLNLAGIGLVTGEEYESTITIDFVPDVSQP